MANISSSTFRVFVQKDGSKTVAEMHSDLIGLTHDLVWFPVNGEDLNARLAAHASDIGDALDAAEVQANVSAVLALGSLAQPTTIYSTNAESLAALRQAFATATRLDAVMIGDFLNTLSNAALAVIFGVTVPQAATIKSNRLAPAASLATSIRASAGQ